jgi:predicted DNA binding protein
LKNSYNVKVASKHYLKKNEKIRPQKLIESGFLEFVSATDKLTKRQIQALKLASNMNYYEIPKQTSLSKLGEKMGISDAAVSELLRKAERKLLPTIARIIDLQN